MSGEQASDPYLRKINSMINAPVREQLESIANWHDSKHPSRMALGAVASSALNYVNSLEARIRELEAREAALTKFAEFCDYHHRSCDGLKGQHLDCDCGYTEARDELRAALASQSDRDAKP